MRTTGALIQEALEYQEEHSLEGPLFPEAQEGLARLMEQVEISRKALERIANDATPLGFKIIAREALEEIGSTLTREEKP